MRGGRKMLGWSVQDFLTALASAALEQIHGSVHIELSNGETITMSACPSEGWSTPYRGCGGRFATADEAVEGMYKHFLEVSSSQ